MTIEVSRCYECPFSSLGDKKWTCLRTLETIPVKNRMDGPLPLFCPLLSESIVVKKLYKTEND